MSWGDKLERMWARRDPDFLERQQPGGNPQWMLAALGGGAGAYAGARFMRPALLGALMRQVGGDASMAKDPALMRQALGGLDFKSRLGLEGLTTGAGAAGGAGIGFGLDGLSHREKVAMVFRLL
jgi:hypothetical protein